jgi:hypothetical protein
MIRLVVIDIGTTAFGPDGYSIGLRGSPFALANFSPGTCIVGPRVRRDIFLRLHIDSRLHIYAGQPDILDASHIIIKYCLNDSPGTIDGWLRDPAVWSPVDAGMIAEAVDLKVRDGPLRSEFWN